MAFADYELAAAGFDAETVSRIRAILGLSLEPQEVRVAGPLEVDPRTRRLTVHGRRVPVSQKEFDLVFELAREPERVFTKDELLRTVWQYPPGCRTRTLDSHASRVRRKLREVAPDDELLVNVWGVGYRLIDT